MYLYDVGLSCSWYHSSLTQLQSVSLAAMQCVVISCPSKTLGGWGGGVGGDTSPEKQRILLIISFSPQYWYKYGSINIKACANHRKMFSFVKKHNLLPQNYHT